ncbi:hypothetical protein SDC9_150410 [bioreactor metagenome]|uniref:Uncharacterized protein n=1 Tax=bioreactor metagenome TaxID=1076179 RepID=A0A645ERN9_9ZZZZ
MVCVYARRYHTKLRGLQSGLGEDRRHRGDFPGVFPAGGGACLPDDHVPHDRRAAHPDRHLQGARVFVGTNLGQIYGLFRHCLHHRQRPRAVDLHPDSAEGHHRRVFGVVSPARHRDQDPLEHVRALHTRRPALHGYSGLVFLPQGAEGRDSRSNAPQDAKKRQEDITGTLDEALVENELLPENHRAKPLPL